MDNRNQRFRKCDRLTRRSDFARVYSRRCRAGDGVLLVYVAENGLAWSRLGMSVGKRVGGAVRRNYARRRIREAFRRNKSSLPKGVDIIAVASAKAAERRSDVAASFKSLVVRAARRCRAGTSLGS